MTQIANNLSLYIFINVIDFMDLKLSLYTLSISKTSCPLIISAYRIKTILIALIPTKH